MARKKKRPAAPAADTSEYSASQAAETRPHREHRIEGSNSRLVPGGADGATAEAGMPAMDREEVPSKGDDPGFTKHGDTPGAEE